MLFGLSMDYEVFLLSRMREEWDKRHDNEQAVAYGLEHTGRIITAAAIIMVAAFSGFTAGIFVGLQEFGIGLSAAILLDATIVRALLVPATMKLLGDWNWYLPERARRALRLRPPAPPHVGAGRRGVAAARSRGYPLPGVTIALRAIVTSSPVRGSPRARQFRRRGDLRVKRQPVRGAGDAPVIDRVIGGQVRTRRGTTLQLTRL